VWLRGEVGLERREESRPLSGQQHQAQFGLNPTLNETRNRRTENSIANCNLSCARMLDFGNFGPPRRREKCDRSFDRPNALAS